MKRACPDPSPEDAAQPSPEEERSHLDHWRATLAGANPYPIARPSQPTDAADTAARDRLADLGATGRGLHRVARETGIPVRALVMAAHVRVLGSLTSHPEVVTTVGRAACGVKGGGLAPMRVRSADLSWLDLARAVLELEREAAGHTVPYRHIMDVAPGLLVDSRLCVTEIGPETIAEGRAGGRGDEFSPDAVDTALPADDFPPDEDGFALSVDVTVDSRTDAVLVDLVCDRRQVHPAVVARLAHYYTGALTSLVADPAAAATRADVRPSDEMAEIRTWSTGPTPSADDVVPLHAQFREWADMQPDRVAVCDLEGSLTYRELDRRAGRLAHRLRAIGVRQGDRVGVCVPRGIDLVVGLLAVLATGAAYVPLDPEFPHQRLEFIATDADLRCLVVGPGVVPPATEVPLVSVAERDGPPSGARDAASPPAGTDGDDVAYVIYTSGSTGRPKGTVIEHRNLANFFLGMDLAVGISPQDRVLALTSVSFDISVLEIMWPLVRGATTIIGPERMVEQIAGTERSLESLIRRFRPTLFQATPSFFTAMTSHPTTLRALSCLRALLVGGEALPRGLARQLTEAVPGVRVLNMYGPTETTIWSLTHELGQADVRDASPPIGRPIAHTRLRLVDGLGNDACIGVPGELWIAGEGVARGYFRRPELDQERFGAVDGERVVAGADHDRLTAVGHRRDERTYRTGDQARWRADGALEFLGRNDRQVKLRGHRIELDEIESVLSEHPEVEAAAVVATEHATRGVELVAYVRPRPRTPTEPRLGQWREVWDVQYRRDGGPSGDESFPGWIDSYTGAHHPEQHMRAWLDATVARVRRLSPRRVVDVGAGSGLLMRDLRAGVEHYLAVDISPAALVAAEVTAAALGKPGADVDFLEGDALILRKLPSASADLVLLNSVAQYFPDSRYLTQVLDEAVRVVGPRGSVFVGDVRDVRLLPMFHADVQVQRSPRLTTAADLSDTVGRLVRSEEELCLAPAYFTLFATRHDGFTARVECRAESPWTEMSRFRWDVTLLGPAHPAVRSCHAQPKAVDWQESRRPAPEALDALLDTARAGCGVRVTDVPNSRLVRPEAALRLLTQARPTDSVWEIARSLWTVGTDHAVDPADLHARGRAKGLGVRVEPARSGRLNCLDVTLG
ncbi:amino acid adenylation domain-containing protein [Streptomyces sp. NPDC091267]|uniref:non-ribosomal peptide synthetase n=1 Tax=Streptomyces sp. NPDC091267 TaxID=3155195 RepID=UPI00342AFBC0